MQTMVKKRSLEEYEEKGLRKDDRQPKSKAKFNIHTLKKLEKAIMGDPEVDLTSKFPLDYSVRPAGMRTAAEGAPGRTLRLK